MSCMLNGIKQQHTVLISWRKSLETCIHLLPRQPNVVSMPRTSARQTGQWLSLSRCCSKQPLQNLLCMYGSNWASCNAVRQMQHLLSRETFSICNTILSRPLVMMPSWLCIALVAARSWATCALSLLCPSSIDEFAPVASTDPAGTCYVWAFCSTWWRMLLQDADALTDICWLPQFLK